MNIIDVFKSELADFPLFGKNNRWEVDPTWFRRILVWRSKLDCVSSTSAEDCFILAGFGVRGCLVGQPEFGCGGGYLGSLAC